MNKFNNIFGQIFNLFPRYEFSQLVHDTESDFGSKGFSCARSVARNGDSPLKGK